MTQKGKDVTPVEEITVVSVIQDTEGQIEKAKTDLTTNTLGSIARLKELQEKYMGITIEGITDLATYNVVKDGLAELKKIRTGIEKKRKELTAPMLKFQSDLKTYADGIAGDVSKIENHLTAQKTKFEDQKKAAELKMYQDRYTKLTGLGYSLANGFLTCGIYNIHSDELGKIDETQFAKYVEWGQQEAERKAAEERIRVEREEAMQRERDEIARQKEELRKQAEENEKTRKELAAQKQALENAYNIVPKETETPAGETPPQHDSFHDVPPQGFTGVGQQAPQQTAQAAKPAQAQPKKEPTPEFSAGFNACRSMVVKLLQMSPPKKREEFIKEINEMPVAYGQ